VPTEWGAEEEAADDVNQWEEDWDDSDANDDFTRQLRAELARTTAAAAPK
jgi:26 proteasome complex subunit DSS1